MSPDTSVGGDGSALSNGILPPFCALNTASLFTVKVALAVKSFWIEKLATREVWLYDVGRARATPAGFITQVRGTTVPAGV